MHSFRAKNRVKRRFQSSKRARRGWTRLEVLLVSSVALLNLAILLPFVQNSREAARKTECKHYLKQVGMAVLNYVDVHNHFYPAGFDLNPDGNYQGWGWNLKILPFLNAADVYTSVEPHLANGIPGLPDTPEFRRRLPSLWCPSDNGSETVPHAKVVTAKVANGIVEARTADWPNRFPHSSYLGNAGYLQVEAGGLYFNAAGIPTSIVPLVNAGSLGNFGTSPAPNHRYCDQEWFGGVFGQNSRVSTRHMVDGTSTIFVIGERYSPADLSASAVGHGTWIGVPDCTRAQGLAMSLADASVRINIGMPLRESTTGFGSLHAGGAHFFIADGEVRFVSQRINLQTFRSLSLICDLAIVGKVPDRGRDSQ